jgi:hypothetical protein
MKAGGGHIYIEGPKVLSSKGREAYYCEAIHSFQDNRPQPTIAVYPSQTINTSDGTNASPYLCSELCKSGYSR